MCKQQQLDSNQYLPKLKRDYALAVGFPNSTSMESLEEGLNSTCKFMSVKQKKRKDTLIDVYRLTNPNLCPTLCYMLISLQW